MENKKAKPSYHTAKPWQIGLFAFNNTATNLYMLAMGYVSYYAVGIAGLLVTVVSVIMTSMRLFDGITDPLIGFMIDKTNSKIGKFRPFMMLGNIILAITLLVLYNTTHLVPESWRLLYFIGIYAIYIIGYTFQTACTKAAQVALTNDPKQRPMFSMFDGIYNTVLFAGMTIFISNVLMPRHGDFTMGLFTDLNGFVVIASAICTILAVIGIWQKDREEFFGIGDNAPALKFKDYWQVIKGNRAIQMLVVAASTDKLAGTIARNSVIAVMLFGIVMGDFGLSGQIAGVTAIPNILLIIFGVQIARKFGQKKAFVWSTWGCIVVSMGLFAVLMVGDPTTISLTSINGLTVAFLVLYILMGGINGVCGNIVIPMIADCSDYETSETGRFVPGMMGTLFSFVDKLISSLGATVIGVCLASIGFTEAMPSVTTPLTNELFWMTMFLYFGIPLLGWIASIIAMKFYPLDDKTMEQVQEKVHALKLAEAE